MMSKQDCELIKFINNAPQGEMSYYKDVWRFSIPEHNWQTIDSVDNSLLLLLIIRRHGMMQKNECVITSSSLPQAN